MSIFPAARPFWVRKLGQLWKLVRESHRQPLVGQPGKPIAIGPDEASVMFLGHSSFLLRLGGKNVGVSNILVDPVFATRLIILRRQRRAGIEIADLPAIDAVLVTHAHMDHLNRPTLRKVARATRRLTGKAPIIVVPHGVEDLVADLGFSEVRTLQWWEETNVSGIEVTLTPAQHWGARMFKDTHRLFGGYVIRAQKDAASHTTYHSGDTAYFSGFKEIGRRLGPIDVALLPIGAYFPDSYRAVHTSPEEALQAFVDVGATQMVPMHFGTFKLGREPMEEPPIRLMAEARRRGLDHRVRILSEGETLLIAQQASPAETGDFLLAGASNYA